MRTQAIQNLIQVSYSVPNGYNLRKACYQYMSLNSRKASPMAMMQLDGLSGLSVEDVTKAAVEVTATVVKSVAQATPVAQEAVKNTIETVAPSVQAVLKNPSKIEQLSKTIEISAQSVAQEASELYQSGYDAVSSAYQTSGEFIYQKYQALVKMYQGLDLQGAFAKLSQHAKEGSQEGILAFFKTYYLNCKEWMLAHMHLDPHTIAIVGGVIAISLLAYYIYGNFNYVKTMLTAGFKKLGEGIVSFATSLSSMGRNVANYMTNLFKKIVRTATIKQAYLTGDQRAIRLASML